MPLLEQSRSQHPFVERAFAEVYNNPRVADANSSVMEIVHKLAEQAGFIVILRVGSSS